jgi:tetratricopeptide (TPR) repeat protein
MIQPLKSSKSSWTLSWVDLDEPVPFGGDFILPTLMMVTDPRGVPVSPPEILEELDQARVESLLGALFDKLGAPQRLVIADSDEWEPENWRLFGEDYGVEIQFTSFGKRDADELRALNRKVLELYATGPHPPHSRDVASGLVNTALRVRSESKKIALLKEAIDRDATCARAHVELADAEFRRGNWKACLHAYDEALVRESWRRAEAPDWWKNQETRPYLRALYGRAMTLWHMGRHVAAGECLQDLLALNRRDNQGARFLIPLVFMIGEDFDAAREAYEQYDKGYPNDYAEPAFLFGRALLEAYFGHDVEAKRRYREAMLKNLYIAPGLLDLPLPSENCWHPNDRSEPSYAREFLDSYAVLWDRVPASLRLLRETHDEMQPKLEPILELRMRMFDYQDQRYDPDYRRNWQNLVAQDERLSSQSEDGCESG